MIDTDFHRREFVDGEQLARGLADEMSRAAEMQHFISDLELVRGVLEAEHAS